MAPASSSVASAPSVAAGWTPTERNWLRALGLVVGGALVFWGILALERAFGHTDRPSRLVWHPVETSMRLFALSHFVVAILFMTTSRSMQSLRSWTWLVGLTGVGVGLCLLFGTAGALASHGAAVLFYAYFLVHEFRDQAFFYRANGDAPPGADERQLRRDLLLVPALVSLVIATVFFIGAAFRVGGARRYTDAVFGTLSPPLRMALGVAAGILCAGAVVWARRHYERTRQGGVAGFVRRNRPLLFVFGGILVVLFLDIAVTGRVYAIVALHVAAWFVFVNHQLAKRPPPSPAPTALSWRWMRSTRAGFNVLHLGVFALIVAAAWASSYAVGSKDGAWALLGREAFPYWTIMHVTMSFVPR